MPLGGGGGGGGANPFASLRFTGNCSILTATVSQKPKNS